VEVACHTTGNLVKSSPLRLRSGRGGSGVIFMRIRISLILLIVTVGLLSIPNPNLMPVPVSAATVDPSIACSVAASQAHAPRIPFTNQSYGKLPLSFEANTGQMDARVRFLSRGAGYGLYLTSNEIVLSLAGKPRAERESLDSLGNGNLPLRGTAVLRRIREKARNHAHAEVRLNFVRAALNPRIEGEHPSPAKSNYLAGTDPRKWHTNIPHYRKVRYRSIYPGIDAVLYGRQRELEYDLEIAPGADPGIIRMKLAGASRLWLNPEGDLIFETTVGCFRQQKPRIYQDFAGGRRWIKGEYILEGKDQFRFAVPQWDSSRPLTIDPTLGYATYLGGSGDENIEGLAVDAQGNVYVTGSTNSSDFPTTAGVYKIRPDSSYPAFIAKIDSSGSALIYSTYIGGQEALGTSGIAVDGNGSAVVCGITFVNEGGINAYAAKLNPSGNKLVYSLDFGGSFDDMAYAVAVDGQGNAYLTGYTQSSDFPAIKAWQPARKGTMDAFVIKLSPTGEKLYSTFLGGSGSWDLGLSIAADAAGNAYVAGETGSQDYPTTSGAYKTTMNSGVYLDIFVTKFDPSGHAPVYSTLLGVNAKSAGGIAIDAAGNAYITGTANSSDFGSASAASQGIGNTAPSSTLAGFPAGRTGYGFGFEKGQVMAQERGYAGSGGALVAKLNSTGRLCSLAFVVVVQSSDLTNLNHRSEIGILDGSPSL